MTAPGRRAALAVLLALLGCEASVEGEVVALGAAWVELAPAQGGRLDLAIPEVLAAQIHRGDRVRAELDGRGVSRIAFLERAKREPAVLAPGEALAARSIPGVDGPILLGEGQGVATVLTFLYTRCGIATACPMVAEKLRSLQGELRGAGRILTLTLDPARDSLEVLRTWAAGNAVDPGTWKVGRLPPGELEPLLASLGVLRIQDGEEVLHDLRIAVFDAGGRLTWRSDGEAWEVAAVAARVREARGGR